ncbi:MAG TPA: hypothetical protein VFP72_18385 [Kineosporiaceae bacterium]|nr:hypothetical protein [Kineosporiaceae bacterium]
MPDPVTVPVPVPARRSDGVPREGARSYLDQVAETLHRTGLGDLGDMLTAQRARLDREDFTVLVVGEFGRGKSALVNGIVGVPVCGVSALRATTVQTVVRYGTVPRAWAVGAPAHPGEPPARRPLDVVEAPRWSLLGPGAAGPGAAGPGPVGSGAAGSGPVGEGPAPVAVEVELPRQLLADGLVLVDTPGVGGGFAAAGAATVIRALSLADALLFVTDASAELTAPEVEFLAEALAVCPTALAVVTKTDLYPQWRQVVELDRGHLAAAGLDVPVLPVSTVLRELAVDTGDPALAAESGFPLLVRALQDGLRRRRRADGCRRAVSAALSALDRAGAQLSAESIALTDPARREDALARLRAAEQRLGRLHGASARWQEVLADEVRAWRRAVPRDLVDRLRELREHVRGRFADGDPDQEWTDFEPWFHREVNRRLTAHHRMVLEQFRAGADTVGRQFDLDQGELGLDLLTGPVPAAGELTRPRRARASWVDLAMTAARGFSVSGAVINIVVVAAQGSLTAVGLPLTAAFGAFFGLRYVRGLREAQTQLARQQVEQAVAAYLQEVQAATTRVDEELVELAYIQLRERLGQLADRSRRDAQAMVAAATRALETDTDGLGDRLAELTRRSRELDLLAGRGRAALAVVPGPAAGTTDRKVPS